MSAVTYESEDGVAVITIRRPEKLNAMNREVEKGLNEAFQRLQDGPDRVGVITGEGTKAFSAGADLVEMPPLLSAYPGIGVVLDKPLIAAVSGHCVGGALVIVMMADLCVATEDSKFMYPEARLGVTGGMIAGLATKIPHKCAMELMILGEPISAKRAYEMGLVNRVVPAGKHLSEAIVVAKRLSTSAPLVLSALKGLVQEQLRTNPAEHAAKVKITIDRIDASKDAKEGEIAFNERREPKYTGV